MGVIYDLLMEINGYPALEAEDITSEVESGTDKALGKKTDDGGDEALAGGTDNSDGEIDTNTDDILGTSDEDDANDDAPEDGEENMDDMNDETPDENAGDPTSGEDSIEDSLEENDNSFEAVRKRKMHKQLLSFFETLNDDIKVINEYVPRESDANTIKALTNINNNLVQCKEYTYKILTEEFKSMEYPILLKKCVAMNRIYDLCIRTLQTYFDAKKEDDEK